MLRVMVCAKCKGYPERDLEVPAEVESGKLGEMIAKALQWEKAGELTRYQYTLSVQPLGRTLQAQESLAQAGVWDGAYVTLHRQETNRYRLETGTGQEYPLSAKEMIIGRTPPDNAESPANLINLRGAPNGQSVLRRHAALKFNESGWQLEIYPEAIDRTFIYEGQALNAPELTDAYWQSAQEITQPCQLQPGMWLRFGNVSIRFLAE